MDTFFNFLRKAIVATICVVFAFVVIYVPQNWNEPETAHAGGWATEATQIASRILQAGINAATSLTASLTNNLWVKEYVLDGIAWHLAKGIVSSMVQSLVNWINSGFEGSPAFVTDLSGFLRNAADEAIGEYLEDLGGIASFICSPFRLDVQIAVALQYERTRIDQPAPTCTLTGVIDNIEGFLGGGSNSFSQGGWDDWIDISANPNLYTPYGQVLVGQAGARAVIRNARGEEFAIANWGDGFLSGEICEAVPGSTRENCWISKPGKIIEEALSFNLDSGRQALITADEIDEVIAALLGQLANKAITGAAGLLGLSGGSPHSYTGFSAGSYLAQMEADSGNNTINTANAVSLMTDTRSDSIRFRNMAQSHVNYYNSIVTRVDSEGFYVYPSITRSRARARRDSIQTYVDAAQADIDVLNAWIAEYPTATIARKSSIISAYSGRTFYTDSDYERWNGTWLAQRSTL